MSKCPEKFCRIECRILNVIYSGRCISTLGRRTSPSGTAPGTISPCRRSRYGKRSFRFLPVWYHGRERISGRGPLAGQSVRVPAGRRHGPCEEKTRRISPKPDLSHGGDRRHERLAFSRSAWYHAKQWVSGISAVGSARGLGETARAGSQFHIGVLRSW